MIYFKDENGGVHALESADFANLLPDGCVEITEVEAAALQQPSSSALRIADIDTRLVEIDQLSARPAREVALTLLSGAAVDSYVTDKLSALEAEAVSLRSERKELST